MSVIPEVISGFFTKIISFFATIFIAKKWGEAREEANNAKETAEEKIEDAKITSKPYESNPFSKLGRLSKKE